MFDLFCGAGGSSCGAVKAGVTPVAALDKWKLAVDTYKLNFPQATIYRMKAASLTPQRFLDEVGGIDLLLASPECTSHSVARGNKPTSDDSRDTAFSVIRFARVLKPRWIVVENVLQMRRWRRFQEWLNDLKAIGYNIQIGVLDAQFHSTPQSRRRIFIVGDLEVQPALPMPGQLTRKTVRTILGTGQPKERPWAFSPVESPKRAKATVERARRAIEKLGRNTSFIMVYYGTDGAGGFQTLDRPLRTVTTIDRFAYVRRNGIGYEMRMLQPSELGAAMGFPRNYLWPASTRREKINLLGNAVCPLVMRDVVKALLAES